MCMNEEQHLQCKMSLINVYESNADGHCSRPNDTLAPSELNCSDCQQHRDKMRQYWRRMECDNKTSTSIDKTCCSSWCRQLASLFSQTSSWRDHCFKMWGCRKNEKTRMQFPIILTNTTDSSYLGRIQVKQCWKPNFIAIKLTPLSEVGVFYFFCNICSAYCYWSFNSPPLDAVETNSPHNHSPRSYR